MRKLSNVVVLFAIALIATMLVGLTSATAAESMNSTVNTLIGNGKAVESEIRAVKMAIVSLETEKKLLQKQIEDMDKSLTPESSPEQHALVRHVGNISYELGRLGKIVSDLIKGKTLSSVDLAKVNKTLKAYAEKIAALDAAQKASAEKVTVLESAQKKTDETLSVYGGKIDIVAEDIKSATEKVASVDKKVDATAEAANKKQDKIGFTVGAAAIGTRTGWSGGMKLGLIIPHNDRWSTEIGGFLGGGPFMDVSGAAFVLPTYTVNSSFSVMFGPIFVGNGNGRGELKSYDLGVGLGAKYVPYEKDGHKISFEIFGGPTLQRTIQNGSVNNAAGFVFMPAFSYTRTW